MSVIARKSRSISLAEEQKLVAGAKAGDPDAMDALLSPHYRQMYHLALKITRNPSHAQDVTQEACVQVLRRIDQFRAESRFSAWLSRIVVNTALLRHRKEKRMIPTAEIFSPSAQSSAPLPERIAGDREVLRLTESLLAGLRDGDRDLFHRRFIDGLSLKSISAETGLSLPALKSRFHRARNRLKAASTELAWGV